MHRDTLHYKIFMFLPLDLCAIENNFCLHRHESLNKHLVRPICLDLHDEETKQHGFHRQPLKTLMIIMTFLMPLGTP